MADPGDPRDPHDDDLIGFASAESLQGRAREPEPEREPGPEPDAGPPPEEPPTARPHPIRANSIFEPSPGFELHRHHREPEPGPIVGGMNLYAIYALILFAVPTLGVSALVGLVAVTGRPGPDEPEARSHFVYQQRTLWAAALAAVVGLILLAAPFALGVPLLFGLALWTVIRGAAGVWTLKAGRPIRDPRSWWI